MGFPVVGLQGHGLSGRLTTPAGPGGHGVLLGMEMCQQALCKCGFVASQDQVSLLQMEA